MHHRRRQDHSSPEHRTGTSRVALLVLLCVAQLMVILDISAVNVALPDMAKDLDISGGDIGWTITSYSLIFGSLLLLGGRAADLIGRRRVFLAGLSVFTLASLASAVAGSAATLFAARAGQGLGAAMLSPAALSIIVAAFTQGGERAKALGAWGAVGGAGAAVGVLLGGTLTELVDWRLIFLINLPVGLILAAGAMKIVPADVVRPRWSGLDLRGALLATLSLGGLVFAASQADSAGWASTQTLGLGAAALAGLAAFAVLELRTAQPLLAVRRLTDRGVGGGSLMMLVVSAVLFGTFLLSSFYMQNVLGTGALDSGLAFLPMAAALAVGVHLGTHIISHGGVRVPLAGALAVTAGGMLLLAGVDADGSYGTDLLPGMLIAGLGLGVALVAVSVSVLTGAADEETGMLSGLNTTGHEIGGSLGVAVLATIATGSLGAVTGPGSTAALAGGIGDAFLAASAIAGIGSVLALAILPSARSFLPKLRLAPPVAVH
jgi:EmrB/QacA subfamily drug resistance transporter